MSTTKHKSQYSPAAIGCRESGINVIRENFKKESGVVLDYLKSTHHVRKNLHLQSHYPDTVTALLKHEKKAKNNLFTLEDQNVKKNNTANADVDKYKQFMNTLQQNINGEHDLNHKKLANNRLHASKAIVSDIIEGKGKDEKEFLFPKGASHNQILALTGTLSMPNPNTIPPEVPNRGKKWLGDDKGWQ